MSRVANKHTAAFFALILLLYSCQPAAWRPLGPFNVNNPSLNFVNMGGKVDDIKISTDYDGHGHPAMFLACGDLPGALGGSGVWRSTDFTSDQPLWVAVTAHLPAVPKDRLEGINNISCIAVDPAHQQSIWAGVGSFPLRLLHSADGGKSWTLVGDGLLGHGDTLHRVIVDPDSRVWVATNDGLYMSTNSGASFQRIDSGQFPADGVSFDDIAWFASGAQPYAVIVGVVHHGTDNSGIWQVTVDGSMASWNKTNMNLQNTYGGSIPFSMIHSIRLSAGPGLGVVASLAQAVEFNCDDPSGSLFSILNIFQLTDGTWQPKWRRQAGEVGDETQGGYCQPVCIAPGGLIYGGGKGMAVSDLTGKLYTPAYTGQTIVNCQITGGTFVFDNYGKTLHPDVQTIMYSAIDDKMYMGTDGGIVRFTVDPQTGKVAEWVSLNSPSLTNFLSESVAVSPYDQNNMLAGHQDNGVIHMNKGKWDYVGGNETDFVYFDATAHAYFLDVSSDEARVAVSTDGGKTFPQHVMLPNPALPPYLNFHLFEPGRFLVACNPQNVSSSHATVYEVKNAFQPTVNTRKLNIPNTGDHFYTISPDIEKPLTLGYHAETPVGWVYPGQIRGTMPLTRWVHQLTGHHFYTTTPTLDNPGVKQYNAEGNACYILRSQNVGSTPLRRWYNAVTDDHMYTGLSTTAEDDLVRKAGYVEEAPQGFVYTSPQPGTIPLTRWYNHFQFGPSAMCYVGETIYVCVDTMMYQGLNDGATWSVTWSHPHKITSIVPDPFNPDAVYVSTNFAEVFYNTHLSTNPADFVEISGNLRRAPIKMSLYSRGPGLQPIIYLATQQHVYRATKLKGMATEWELFDNGLPATVIRDIQVSDRGNMVFVATYGRGVWSILDLDQLK